MITHRFKKKININVYEQQQCSCVDKHINAVVIVFFYDLVNFSLQ